MKFLLALVSFLAAPISHSDVDVVGADHRREVSELRGPLRSAARSVATMVDRSGLIRNDSNNTFRFANPNTSFLCSDQKFAGQPSPPAVQCGATLVAPDLVLTAAHCMQDEMFDCGASLSFVFDYTDNKTEFPESNVYHCKELAQPVILGNGVDVALIRLDRPVENFKPVIMSEAPLRSGDQLTLIGPPKGLPLKASSGAIRYINSNPSDRSGIGADFDCSGKNSGSPVFNGRGESVGILIASGHLNSAPPRARSESIAANKRLDQKCYNWLVEPANDAPWAYQPNPDYPADYSDMGVLARGCVFIPHHYFIDAFRSTINGSDESQPVRQPAPRQPSKSAK
jgi:V8-like Glu-specific endopeptidase